MMRGMILAVSGLVFLATTVGCSPLGVARTGMKIVKGVEADVLEIRPPAAAALRPFQSVRVGEVSTDVGPICPSELLAALRVQLPASLARETKDRFTGGGKTLVVDAVCRFFKKKSMVGSEGRLDLLVTLTDGEGGEPLGRVYVEGVTESPLHTGLDDMAKAVSKALARYLDDLKKRSGR